MNGAVTLSATGGTPGNIKESPGKLMSLTLSAGSEGLEVSIVDSTTAAVPVVFGAIGVNSYTTTHLPIPAGGVYFSTGIRAIVNARTTSVPVTINATYE